MPRLSIIIFWKFCFVNEIIQKIPSG